MSIGFSSAGCSDETPGSPSQTPSDDGGSDARTPPRPSDGDDDAGGPESCMIKEAIDETKYPYKPASIVLGACTEAETKKLTAFYKEKSDAQQRPTREEWAEQVSDTCATCVFSDGEGDTWTPVVFTGDTSYIANHGGCVRQRGASEACGEASQRWSQCIREACLTKCTTRDDYAACRSDFDGLRTGPCKGAYAKLTAACDMAKLQGWDQKCSAGSFIFDGPIKYMCAQPDPDAGGGEDAGDAGDAG